MHSPGCVCVWNGSVVCSSIRRAACVEPCVTARTTAAVASSGSTCSQLLAASVKTSRRLRLVCLRLLLRLWPYAWPFRTVMKVTGDGAGLNALKLLGLIEAVMLGSALGRRDSELEFAAVSKQVRCGTCSQHSTAHHDVSSSTPCGHPTDALPLRHNQ